MLPSAFQTGQAHEQPSQVRSGQSGQVRFRLYITHSAEAQEPASVRTDHEGEKTFES